MENLALDRYLKIMIEKDASDLYLSTGAIPSLKIHGELIHLQDESSLSLGKAKELAYSIMNPQQIERFENELEMNLAISRSGIGRFRVNVFKQRSETALVIRHIKTQIPSLEELALPETLKQLIMQKRGLILFVGATGAGKSTSLASLINYRNEHSAGHIVTIEDPIEFVHSHKRSIVNQREVGIDTISYEEALKNTLRQAPDVILIGEIRSMETMKFAINFAETGHLCLSTLHANNANQAMERILNFFPSQYHSQLLLDLSLNLRGVISQRLIPNLQNTRSAAFEILLGTPYVSDLIKRGEVTALKDAMQRSEEQGMQTFETALYKLYESGMISLEEALHNADSENNLRLKIALKQDTANLDTSKLSLLKPTKNALPSDRLR